MQSHWQNQPEPATLNRECVQTHVQRHNMAGFRASKLDTVRVGVIGLGNRGPNHLKALVQIANVEIRALCDKNPAQLERGLVWARGAGHTLILPPSKAAMAFDDQLARQWVRDHREGK